MSPGIRARHQVANDLSNLLDGVLPDLAALPALNTSSNSTFLPTTSILRHEVQTGGTRSHLGDAAREPTGELRDTRRHGKPGMKCGPAAP
jgi:hypothetical protein